MVAWRLPAEIQDFDVILAPYGAPGGLPKFWASPMLCLIPVWSRPTGAPWEGAAGPDLRQDGGADFFARSTRLDFPPPGGESPRMVQHRLQPLLPTGRQIPPCLLIFPIKNHRTLCALATRMADGGQAAPSPGQRLPAPFPSAPRRAAQSGSTNLSPDRVADRLLRPALARRFSSMCSIYQGWATSAAPWR